MPDYGHELAVGAFLTPQYQPPAEMVALDLSAFSVRGRERKVVRL
jgi:hypothetical protein